MADPLAYYDYDTRLAAYAVVADEQGRYLLTWFNGGTGRDRPGWSLPGGGVDYEESFEDCVVREVKEETGLDVVVGRPLLTHSFTGERSRHTGNPYKSARVVFDATVVGGVLGTLEVGGTTDFAQWVSPTELGDQHRADIVDLAISAHLASTGRGAQTQQDR